MARNMGSFFLLWLVSLLSSIQAGRADSCDHAPPEIINGQVKLQELEHGQRAMYECEPGYIMRGDGYLTCVNGQWEGYPSTCRTEYCPYPGTIRNGMILLVGELGKYEYRPFVKKIGQNTRIEFLCDTGYILSGSSGSTCLDGIWTPEKKPHCVPNEHTAESTDTVYCPYPGTIENGKILLVGELGKYEYRPYVKNIGQNRRIEFVCDMGYIHSGSMGSTCLDGTWTPGKMPSCVKKHEVPWKQGQIKTGTSGAISQSSYSKADLCLILALSNVLTYCVHIL